jgi:hypothetical protein
LPPHSAVRLRLTGELVFEFEARPPSALVEA